MKPKGSQSATSFALLVVWCFANAGFATLWSVFVVKQFDQPPTDFFGGIVLSSMFYCIVAMTVAVVRAVWNHTND